MNKRKLREIMQQKVCFAYIGLLELSATIIVEASELILAKQKTPTHTRNARLSPKTVEKLTVLSQGDLPSTNQSFSKHPSPAPKSIPSRVEGANQFFRTEVFFFIFLFIIFFFFIGGCEYPWWNNADGRNLLHPSLTVITHPCCAIR